jgi:hypothetical protein
MPWMQMQFQEAGAISLAEREGAKVRENDELDLGLLF